MSPLFRIALGLAAIDGLTSAFVATIMLALTLIGSGEGGAAPDWTRTHTLVLSKETDARMVVRLSITLELVPDHKAPIFFPVTLFDGLQPVEASRAVAEHGLFWQDCTRDDGGNHCPARLFIVQPAPACWVMHITPAFTPQAFRDGYPHTITIAPGFFGSQGTNPMEKRTTRLDQRLRLFVNMKDPDHPTLRWLDGNTLAPPC